MTSTVSRRDLCEIQRSSRRLKHCRARWKLLMDLNGPTFGPRFNLYRRPLTRHGWRSAEVYRLLVKEEQALTFVSWPLVSSSATSDGPRTWRRSKISPSRRTILSMSAGSSGGTRTPGCRRVSPQRDLQKASVGNVFGRDHAGAGAGCKYPVPCPGHAEVDRSERQQADTACAC